MTFADDVLPWALAVLAAVGVARGLPLLALGLRRREESDAPIWLLRGARWAIAGAACACIAAGIAAGSRGLTYFGIAFLAEELYETTLVLVILRWGKRRGFV